MPVVVKLSVEPSPQWTNQSVTVSMPGSVITPRVRLYELPSLTLEAPLMAIEGATLATDTIWDAVLPVSVSESVKLIVTVGVAGPSGNRQLKLPVWLPEKPVTEYEPPTTLPPEPQSGLPEL